MTYYLGTLGLIPGNKMSQWRICGLYHMRVVPTCLFSFQLMMISVVFGVSADIRDCRELLLFLLLFLISFSFFLLLRLELLLWRWPITCTISGQHEHEINLILSPETFAVNSINSSVLLASFLWWSEGHTRKQLDMIFNKKISHEQLLHVRYHHLSLTLHIHLIH